MNNPNSVPRKSIWRTQVSCLLVTIFGCVSAAAAEPSEFTTIDLTAYYDESGAWHRPGEWEDVPHGAHTFGGVPFAANGLNRLIGEGARKDKRSHRETVEGIVVGKKFARLHLLHTAHYPAEDETPYARIILRYADGSKESLQLLFGRHARDWWRSKSEAFPDLSDPRSKVVWRGDDAGLKEGRTRRIFRTTFENPHPGKEVIAIDLLSENAIPNLTLFAITVGPATLPAPQDDTPGLPEPEPPVGAIRFTAVDAETGTPVPNVKLKISGDAAGESFRSEVSTDRTGKCVVKHPGTTTTSLTIQVSGAEVTPTRIRWQMARRQTVPSNYVFRVSKPIRIGGTVLDEANQPIANAKIQFRDYSFGDTSSEAVERFQIHSSSATTSVDGTWEFKNLPPRFREFSVNISHPEFVDARFITHGIGRGFSNMPIAKLADKSAVVQLRRRGPVYDEAGKPIMENILPNVAAGTGGIKNALPWWKELSSGARDGVHDPAAPPGKSGTYGIAWGIKGFPSSVFVFQTKQMLTFDSGGWYVQVNAPENSRFTAEDLGRIQADWIVKTYGIARPLKVQHLK